MCRVTMGHLRVTVGHLRVTIGHLRVTKGHFWLTIGQIRVTVGHSMVTIGHLRATMGHLRLTIGYLKATVVYIRVIFQYSSKEESYFGGDYEEHSIAAPLCQKPISDGNTDLSTSTYVPLIFGVSAASLLVIMIIIVIVLYLWKRNSRGEVIDKNDQYGNREDYYEYEKDNYNTKVTDSVTTCTMET